jgi:hypothetical protein
MHGSFSAMIVRALDVASDTFVYLSGDVLLSPRGIVDDIRTGAALIETASVVLGVVSMDHREPP